MADRRARCHNPEGLHRELASNDDIVDNRSGYPARAADRDWPFLDEIPGSFVTRRRTDAQKLKSV